MSCSVDMEGKGCGRSPRPFVAMLVSLTRANQAKDCNGICVRHPLR